MSQTNFSNLSGLSMLDLFRLEVENQSAILTEGLLALERERADPARLESLMRAAHSLKGAARLVALDPAVKVAHAMEDCLVAAQADSTLLTQQRIDVLLRGVDLLSHLAREAASPVSGQAGVGDAEVEAFLRAISAQESSETPPSDPAPLRLEVSVGSIPTVSEVRSDAPPSELIEPIKTEDTDRVLRVGADHLTRLLSLAGESVVASRWLAGFTADYFRLKQMHGDLTRALNRLRQSLAETNLNEQIEAQLIELQYRDAALRDSLGQNREELEQFDRRFYNLSTRLYQEVLDCRMRPFADGVRGFPRMVREVGRTLGRQVRLEIIGESVPVDRDILEHIEAPLGHLLRNAVDHGLEPPAERRAAGKTECGLVRLEARHSAGWLVVSVEDDGRGIDPETLRAMIVKQDRVTEEVAGQLSEAELLEFLFLPGFTGKETITEISGRGVGLDAVQTTVKGLGGRVQVFSQPGQGTRFQLQLPITLSVLRALLVDIGGEPYAFPLARVGAAMRVSREKIESIEGRQHVAYQNERIGLVVASQVLELPERDPSGEDLSVVLLSVESGSYGLVVDRFIGEQELVVRPLDARLGKIQDVSAAALMPDQSPVLILDVDDLARSIEKLTSGGQLARVQDVGATHGVTKRKRILVVDDSLTVRELERKLIESRGYEVEVAVDGMDGWNAVRTGTFALVLTDVDMPRMDGIELVTLIKKDIRLQSLPVMIVSYKDREEDRLRGMEAGADYYLTKSSFHDETLLQAVADLIGEADE
jgi:two-component system, chemotaxis family, sensor histidine kinase and response regulator WspE